MATETEIERLVVRLTGDNTQYQAVLESTVQESITNLRLLEDSFNEVAAQGKLMDEASGALESVESAARAVGATMYDLNELVQQGVISEEEFILASEELSASVLNMNNALAAAREAQEAENAALADAERLKRSILEPQQLYEEGVARVRDHLLEGRITQDEYNAALDKLATILPETAEAKRKAAEAQSELNRAEREAAGIIERNKTELEKYDDRLITLSSHLVTGRISQREYDAEVEKASHLLPDVIAKNQERIEQEKFLIELEKLHLKTLSDLRKEDEAMINADIKAAQVKAGEALKPQRGFLGELGGQLTQKFGLDKIGGVELSSLATKAGLVGAAVGGIAAAWKGVNTAIHETEAAMKEIEQLVNSANRSGINVEDFQLLSFDADMANLSMGQLEGGIKKYSSIVLKAAEGNNRAEKSLRQLHLTAKDLINLPLNEQLELIGDKLDNVATHAEKVRIAGDLFGKGGTKFLDMLTGEKSREQEFLNPRVKQALFVTKEEAAQVKEATDAMNLAGKSWEGVWRQSAVTFAPMVADAGHQIAYAVAAAADSIREMRAYWGLTPEADPNATPEVIPEVSSDAGKAFIEDLEFQAATFGKTKDEIALYKAELEGLTEADLIHAKVLQQTIAERERVADALKKQAAEEERTREAIDKSIESLEKSVATHGMSSAEIAIYDLKQRGATDADIARAEALAEQKEALAEADKAEKEYAKSVEQAAKERTKLLEEGKRVTEGLASPAEKFKKEVANLDKLFKEGAIGVETWDKAVTELEKDLAEKEFNLTLEASVEGLDAVRAGTKEFMDLQRETASILAADEAYGNKMKELREGRAAPDPNFAVVAGSGILKPGVSTDEAVTWLSKIAGSLTLLVGKEAVVVEETSLASL